MKAHRNRRAALMLSTLAERRAVRQATQRLLGEDDVKPLPFDGDPATLKAWSRMLHAMKPSLLNPLAVIKMDSCIV